MKGWSCRGNDPSWLGKYNDQQRLAGEMIPNEVKRAPVGMVNIQWFCKVIEPQSTPVGRWGQKKGGY